MKNYLTRFWKSKSEKIQQNSSEEFIPSLFPQVIVTTKDQYIASIMYTDTENIYVSKPLTIYKYLDPNRGQEFMELRRSFPYAKFQYIPLKKSSIVSIFLPDELMTQNYVTINKQIDHQQIQMANQQEKTSLEDKKEENKKKNVHERQIKDFSKKDLEMLLSATYIDEKTLIH